MDNQDTQKSYADLLREVSRNAKELFASEIDLVRIEAKSSFKTVERHSYALIISVWFVLFAPLGLFASAILVLGDYWEGRYWLSSLVVGASALFVGLVLMKNTVKKIRSEPKLMQATQNTLNFVADKTKENVEDVSIALSGGKT